MMLWAKPDALLASRKIITRDDSSSNRIFQIHETDSDGDIQIILSTVGTQFGINITSTTNPFTAGSWHLIAATYNSGTGQGYLYVDGAEVGNDTDSGNMRAGSIAIKIGGCQASGGSAFDGKIDEVRYYNRALSLSEIQAYYKRHKYASPEPTTTIYAEQQNISFSYRAGVNITNGGNALSDYQVSVTVDTASLIAAGKMKNDCSDIRFAPTDDYDEKDWSISYPYWIESGCNSATTEIWVKVDSIAGDPTDTLIYMYYGNGSASAGSDGGNTFEFFDDFPGSSLDTDKWDITGIGSMTTNVSGGELRCQCPSSSGKIYSKAKQYGSGHAARFKWKGWPTNTGYTLTGFHNWEASPDFAAWVARQDSAQWRTDTRNENVGTNSSEGTTGSGTFQVWDIYWKSNSEVEYFREDVSQQVTTTNIPDESNLYFSIQQSYQSPNAADAYYDWVLVRKYTSNTVGTSCTVDAINPAISSGTLASDNSYIDIAISEPTYNAPGGAGALAVADFALTFVANGGNATGASISSVTTTAGGALAGGETTIRANLSITGDPSGVETVEIKAAANSIYDATGNAMANTETTGAKTLNDKLAPVGGTIQINGVDAYITSKDTTLTLSATGASWMKFSNDNITYSTYEAYNTSKAWDITNATYGGTSGDGGKTVYVIYKDTVGNEAAAENDNIIYDTTSPTNPTAATEGQGAVNDTWNNNKNDPNFTSFTDEYDINGVAGFYVYFGTSSTGANTDNEIVTDAFNPASFATSNTRYLRVITKDNAGLYADPDGAGTACDNTNANRPTDPDCWATIFIHKYDIDNPNTPSPSVSPVSWTKTNDFDFSWSDPGDVGGSGVKDYTYQTDAGTGATTTSNLYINNLISNANGTKLFSVKANDNAGNSGSNGTVNFYYDNTNPTNAGTVTDGNGSLDDVWGTVSDPDFTWVAGTDSGDQSGVKEYDVYWGTSSTGTDVTATVGTNAYDATVIPVANTPYYLRIRTRDNALNESAWETKYTMKYSQAASSPSGLSQTANAASLALGDWTTDTTPTLNFTLSDPDAGDTLGYIIKIDDTSDFSSLVTHYTYSANDLASGAEYSFTVGQAVGTGTYTAGTAGQTLGDGQYYWKVQAVESHGLASSEVTANGGAVAFGVDNVDPTGTTLGFGSLTINSIIAQVSGATDALSGLDATAPYYFENTTAGTNSGWQAGTSWDSGSLSANTQYTFKVTSKDKAGNTQETATQNKYTLANQVTALVAANATDKSNYKINLSWTNQGQSGMKIEQDTNCDGYETTLYDNASVNATSPYSVSVSANTCYQFRISSYNTDGILNTVSIPETSQITSPPAQPLSLTHTSNTETTIIWDWGDVTGATGYKVYDTGDNLLQTILTATSTWTQDSLSANASSSIYVRATNANGEGIASSSATAYTSANAPMSASHSANTVSSINWSWASGGAQKDYYAWTTTPAANSGYITNTFWNQSSGLAVNTQYTFSVKARNEDNDETGSVSSSAYSSQNIPTGITFGTVTENSIIVSAQGTFSNLTSGSSGLYFLNATNSNTPDWLQTNSWTNSSLDPNTQYFYQVKSRNGDTDETSYCAAASQYTLANVPAAPTINNATATALDVNVNVNFNPAATEFAIYKETGASCDGVGGSYLAADGSDNGGTAVWQTDTLWGTKAATGLSESTQYSFCVKARNDDNTETVFGSSASGTTNANIPTDPSNAALSEITATSMKLTWTDNSSNETGFKIERSTDGISYAQIGTVLADIEEYTGAGMTSLSPNTQYYFRVRTYNASGDSNYSTASAKYTLANIPSSLTLTADSTTQITASWNANSNSAGTEYYIENTTAGTNSGWTTFTSWTSSNLECGISYSFKVKARNGDNTETGYTGLVSAETESCGGGGLPSGTFNPPTPPTPTPENPKAEFGVLINSGDKYTNNEAVVLKLNVGADTVRMAISDNSNFENVSQIPYQEEVEWNLSENLPSPLLQRGNTCVVYVKFYTQYGVASEVVSDSIILDTVVPEITINNQKDSYSTKDDILLYGTTEPYAKVVFSLSGGVVNEVNVDNNEYWSINLNKLSEGSHILKLTPQDQAGNIGNILQITLVVEKEIISQLEEQEEAKSEIPETEIPKEESEQTTEPENEEESVEPEEETTETETPIEPEEEPEEIVTVPEEAPIALNGQWQLLSQEPIKKFVLDPLPSGIESLVEKFPELKETLRKTGVNKITDFDKLQNIELVLPGLVEVLGLPETETALLKEIKIADLPASAKENIPEEIVFVKTGGESIDVGVDLTVTNKGLAQQKFSAVANSYLTLVVKPESKVKNVKGYLAFKSGIKNNELGIKSNGNWILDIGYWDIKNYVACAFAGTSKKDNIYNSNKEVEEKLVLQEFEYADPDNDGIYTAKIKMPVTEGEYEVITIIEYEDPDLGTRAIKLTAVIDPEGYVYERIKNQELRIKNATVSLFWLNPQTNQYERWLSEKYQQKNPQITDATGKYSFLVPEGTYYLKVETSGYLVYQSEPFEVKEDKGVHINIEMKTKYGWLKGIDWKAILLILVIILLAYNFYRDRKRNK